MRDPQHGANLALPTPAAFAERQPTAELTWFLYLDATEVDCIRAVTTRPAERITFSRTALDVGSP